MAVNYDDETKAARMEAVCAEVAGGKLELGTSGMRQVLAAFDLSGSGGSVRGKTWEIEFAASEVLADNEGKASSAQIKDAAGRVRISGLTVSPSSGDIVLDDVLIRQGHRVTLTSASITHA